MTDRLYVGNISFSTTEEDLREAFGKFGSVMDVKIVTDRDTGRPRGFAFLTMASQDEAIKAIGGMNDATLDGRPLRVNEAEERPSRGRGGVGDRDRRTGGGGRRGRDRGGNDW